jgi:hypothetical protein
MKYKLILIFLLFGILSFGQNQKTDNIIKKSANSIQNKVQIDTIKIQTVESKQIDKIWYKDNNMPWLVALIISILGVCVNLLIAFRSLKYSKINLDSQIKSSTDIANNQIKATLNTNNRQVWLTNVRDVLSELITQSKLMYIELIESDIPNETVKTIHEKLTYNHVKLLLLLNPNKSHHKDLLKSLVEFMTILDKQMLDKHHLGNLNENDNIKFTKCTQDMVESGRALLYTEWSKIQSII